MKAKSSPTTPERLKMWKKLTLRARLSLPMAAMVVVALGLGGIALEIVSPDQFEYENAQDAHSAEAVTAALNAALAVSPNPQATLEAFARGLGNSNTIVFRSPGAPPSTPRTHGAEASAPDWFVGLMTIPAMEKSYPVLNGTVHVGDIVYTPDLSADMFEKWVGFLAIVASGSTLMLLAALSAYFTSGSAIRPLQQLQAGLTRLREGDYDARIEPSGPPEIRESCEEANELARTLTRLSQDNRDLLRKVVSLQDDERRDLARELHDELGPLLFAIRANTTALTGIDSDEDPEPGTPAHGILQAAEALQQANRRILEGLSPLYVQELGLEQSIQRLLRNAQAQGPQIKLTTNIDPRLNGVEGVLTQTIYRVIQEGVTNVLRHAQATTTDVKAAMTDQEVAIEISDNGVGFANETTLGRGLTGMRERVRALNGSFELLRDHGHTLVRCRLPLERGTGG